MDDLELQCEDALFELCDARERYPLQCAEELQKSIKLQNDINMLKVFKTHISEGELPTLEQSKGFLNSFNIDDARLDDLDNKLENIINKLDNLKDVMNQVQREKTCLTNKLLDN